MRAVFFGTPQFAVPSLAALREDGIDIAAVVTQPDRPAGRSRSALVAPPVKQFALDAGIPVWQPERPRGEPFVAQFRDIHADIAIVVAYGHLLRPEVLTIPRLGFVNVHASLLPRWRGAAPIQWALLSGDTQTGVSIMRIEAGLDTGAVWSTVPAPIDADDTTATLFSRLAELGARSLVDILPRIAAGAQPTAQPEHGVTHAPKIDRAAARIDWNEPAHRVSCRLRAMDPAPGAWTTLDGAEMKLFGPSERATAEARAPGEILSAADEFVVAASSGAIAVAEVQPAGKRRMPAAEWLHGTRLARAARLV